MKIIKDPFLKVRTINASPNPQQVCWLAAHQDYSEDVVYNITPPPEHKAGEYIIKHCLQYGHWGIIEHPQIVVNAGHFPHDVMQQLRTHRVGVSFDVQSGRYSGKRILDVVEGKRDIEEVFFFRPVDSYTNRQGKKYEYTEDDRKDDIDTCYFLAEKYAKKIARGMAEEHARHTIPYCLRQHFVLSGNARAMMHIVGIRGTKDVQPETYTFAHLLLQRLVEWMPEVFNYFEEKRFGKNLLAP